MLYMFFLLVLGVVIVPFCTSKAKKSHGNELEWIGGGLVCYAIFVALTIYPGIAMTGGLMETYSQGERIGYITKVSYKGLVHKTNEIQMQVGTGQMAALQEPHPFSCDKVTSEALTKNMGRKARVFYNEWIIMPFNKGSSGYWITKIEWLDDVEDEADAESEE